MNRLFLVTSLCLLLASFVSAETPQMLLRRIQGEYSPEFALGRNSSVSDYENSASYFFRYRKFVKSYLSFRVDTEYKDFEYEFLGNKSKESFKALHIGVLQTQKRYASFAPTLIFCNPGALGVKVEFSRLLRHEFFTSWELSFLPSSDSFATLRAQEQTQNAVGQFYWQPRETIITSGRLKVYRSDLVKYKGNSGLGMELDLYTGFVQTHKKEDGLGSTFFDPSLQYSGTWHKQIQWGIISQYGSFSSDETYSKYLSRLDHYFRLLPELKAIIPLGKKFGLGFRAYAGKEFANSDIEKSLWGSSCVAKSIISDSSQLQLEWLCNNESTGIIRGKTTQLFLCFQVNL